MDTKKKQNTVKTINVMETLKEVGSGVSKSVNKASSSALKTATKELLQQTPQQFLEELLGLSSHDSSVKPGESLSVGTEDNQKKFEVRRQFAYEKQLRQREEIHIRNKTQELRIQLDAIMQEVVIIAQDTEELAQETKLAAMQVPIEPGEYHVNFFENMLTFLRSFRKKIQNANVWLHSYNSRAQKKNWVNNYKKNGAKYLLSGEHYLTRSAG